MARALNFADARRRGPGRRATVVGGGATLALALAAAVIVWLPPTGDTVVFSQPPPPGPVLERAEPAVPTPELEDASAIDDEESAPTPQPPQTTEPQADTAFTEPQPAPQPTESHRPPPEDDTDYGPVFWERRFNAVAADEDGQPRPQPDVRITIWFDQHPHHEPHQQEMMGWHGGCKPTFTPVVITAERMHLDFENSIHATGGPPCESDEYREQSQWIEEFLRTDPFWRLEGDRLWLWSGDTVTQFAEGKRDARPAIR